MKMGRAENTGSSTILECVVTMDNKSKHLSALVFVSTCVCSVSSLFLSSHLQVDISDPFDDPMRRPHQRIHILVLTLYPAHLQRLENISTKEFHPAEDLCLVHAYICWFALTSLSKLSECSSSMPSSKLTWWNFLLMLR